MDAIIIGMEIPQTKQVIAWKLKPLLDSRDVTRYALQKQSEVPMNTIRAMYDGNTARVDFSVLDRIINALRIMTGEDITLADVLEWRPT